MRNDVIIVGSGVSLSSQNAYLNLIANRLGFTSVKIAVTTIFRTVEAVSQHLDIRALEQGFSHNWFISTVAFDFCSLSEPVRSELVYTLLRGSYSVTRVVQVTHAALRSIDRTLSRNKNGRSLETFFSRIERHLDLRVASDLVGGKSDVLCLLSNREKRTLLKTAYEDKNDEYNSAIAERRRDRELWIKRQAGSDAISLKLCNSSITLLDEVIERDESQQNLLGKVYTRYVKREAELGRKETAISFGKGYLRRSTTDSNHDCPYTQIGWNRDDAFNRLMKAGIEWVTSRLKHVLLEAVVEPDFYGYLCTTETVAGVTYDQIVNQRSEYSEEWEVICSYLRYDVQEKRKGTNWIHSIILYSLAELHRIQLRIWSRDSSLEHQNSLNRKKFRYEEIFPALPNPDRVVDLLCISDTYFEKLELIGYSDDAIPESGINPIPEITAVDYFLEYLFHCRVVPRQPGISDMLSGDLWTIYTESDCSGGYFYKTMLDGTSISGRIRANSVVPGRAVCLEDITSRNLVIRSIQERIGHYKELVQAHLDDFLTYLSTKSRALPLSLDEKIPLTDQDRRSFNVPATLPLVPVILAAHYKHYELAKSLLLIGTDFLSPMHKSNESVLEWVMSNFPFESNCILLTSFTEILQQCSVEELTFSVTMVERFVESDTLAKMVHKLTERMKSWIQKVNPTDPNIFQSALALLFRRVFLPLQAPSYLENWHFLAKLLRTPDDNYDDKFL